MRGRPPKIPTEDLPNRLRELRLGKGWSLAKLGQLVGWNAQNVQRHETGEMQLKIHHLNAYAEALGCRPGDIIKGERALTPRENALIELYRKLPPGQRDALFRIGGALAEPEAEPYQLEDRKKGES